jgi:hypothetical protein
VRALTCVLACSLSGCGGGNSTLGGNLSGLGAGLSLTIQDNSSVSLTLTANGAWAFPGTAPTGSYDVVITSQPTGETCTVSNGSGTWNASDASVASIAITCGSPTTVDLGVSGLASGSTVILTDGTNNYTVTGNGTFSYAETLLAGDAYTFSVVTQPSGQTCTITNGTGTVTTGTAISVTVTCT